MKVRKENSKTGKGRLCVAPVRDRVEKVKKYYKQLGVKQDKGDFLFINPTSKQRNSYGRMVFYNRLKKVFLDSGLQDEFDAENKSFVLNINKKFSIMQSNNFILVKTEFFIFKICFIKVN